MSSRIPQNALTLAALGVLLLIPLALVPRQPQATSAPQILRIGTWNLHRFGHPSVPRSTEDLERMASLISAAGVHVLAVQEVVVTRLGDAGEARSYAMDELISILDQEHGEMWDYWLHRGQGDLQLGFMWRTEIVDLKAAPLMGLASKKVACEVVGKKGKSKTVKVDPFPHYPVIAHVSTGDGRSDFSLINLHLTAPAPTWGKDSLWESRRAACGSVATWVDGMYSPEKKAKPAGTSKKKGNPQKQKGMKVPGAVLPGLLGGPAFKPSALSPQTAALAGIKDVLGHLDHDLAVLGMLNASVNPERDLEPLLDLGMHLVGDDQPTHPGGDVDERVLLTVPMGEEHVLASSQVPVGQDFTVTPSVGKGMSPNHLVSFVVPIRPDDD